MRVTYPYGCNVARKSVFDFTPRDVWPTVSEGNAKLKKTARKLSALWGKPVRIVGFGLPPETTCPRAGECKRFCYAKQGQFVRRSVQESRARNLAFVLAVHRSGDPNDSLATELVRVIDAHTPKRGMLIIRLHDSGDFFSAWYRDAWFSALCQRPNVIAYAYTKSHAGLDWSTVPGNLRLTQSCGGKDDALMRDDKPHARVFASHADREAAGYVDGTESDIPAILGHMRLGLVYHGNETLRVEL